MRFEKAFIPYGGYWSTPFCKWQGSLAGAHAIELAATTTRAAMAQRDIPASELDGVRVSLLVEFLVRERQRDTVHELGASQHRERKGVRELDRLVGLAKEVFHESGNQVLVGEPAEALHGPTTAVRVIARHLVVEDAAGFRGSDGPVAGPCGTVRRGRTEENAGLRPAAARQSPV